MSPEASLIAEVAEATLKRNLRVISLTGTNGVFLWDAKAETLGLASVRSLKAQVLTRQVSPEQSSGGNGYVFGDDCAKSYPYQLSLFLLGSHVLVRCREHQCYLGIREYFGPAILTESWSSPDVIVDCDWADAGRWLFRARPGDNARATPLEGVHLHVRGQERPIFWTSNNPPIPPWDLEPLKGRFIGLHAGAVVLGEGGALIFAGDRGSGKTTLTLTLVNKFGGTLLTDETACIYTRTTIVEPFPQAIGVKSGEDARKRRVSADSICERVAVTPAPASSIVFLEPTHGIRGIQLAPLTPADSLRLLLNHHLDLGSPVDDAMMTLFLLAYRLQAVVCRYGAYEDLLEAVPTALLRWAHTAASANVHELKPRQTA